MRAHTWVVALTLYLLTAFFVTYPLAAKLGSVLPGVEQDGGLYLWCVDTFWAQLRAGESPFFTNRIFVPLGANLAYSACVPSLGLIGWPFLSHLILYGGLVAIASLVLAGLTMMLLVYELTEDTTFSMVAGLLYGFSPPLLALLEYSQFHEVTAAALLPVAFLFLLRFVRTASWRSLVWLSVTVWAIHFTFVYTSVAFIVMAVIVSLAVVRRFTVKHVWRGLIIASANVLLLWTMMATLMPPTDLSDIPHGGRAMTSRANANLADVLVPSDKNPFLGSLHARWATDPNDDVASYFVGWGILALAIGAVARRRDPELAGLALAGATVLVLACGSLIRAGGTVLLTNEWTPFDWLARLPGFSLLDAPRRLIVGTSVAVTALAGVGLATLAASSGRRRAVLFIGLLLFAIEYGQVGMTVSPIPVPAIYRQLAAEPETHTLLELGGGLAGSNLAFGLDWSTPSAHLAYWQTIHGKPRVGGYVSRIPWSTFNWFHNVPIMTDLLTMVHASTGLWSGRHYTSEEVGAFVRRFDLGYVIIPPYPRQREYADVVESLFADRIAKRDGAEGYILYTLRSD